MITMSFNEVTKYAQGVELRNRQTLESWRERTKAEYKTQEECQEQNEVICNFEACDYIPAGKTIEEVCGPNLTKGWKPSLVPIPSFYRGLAEIKLTINGMGGEQRLSVLPPDLVITYGTGAAVASSKPIELYQKTFLTNKFILYEFDSLSKRMPQPTATSTDPVRYALTLIAGSEQTPAPDDVSASCWSSRCPREFTDLKNDIIRMWGEPIPEK
jgi:hypothetical protein